MNLLATATLLAVMWCPPPEVKEVKCCEGLDPWYIAMYYEDDFDALAHFERLLPEQRVSAQLVTLARSTGRVLVWRPTPEEAAKHRADIPISTVVRHYPLNEGGFGAVGMFMVEYSSGFDVAVTTTNDKDRQFLVIMRVAGDCPVPRRRAAGNEQ